MSDDIDLTHLKAWECLITNGISSLPVDAFKIAVKQYHKGLFIIVLYLNRYPYIRAYLICAFFFVKNGCSKFSCIAQEANFQRRPGVASGRGRRTSSTQESAPVRRLKVNLMEMVLYPTPKSPVNCGICTVNDKLAISFSRTIIEPDIIRYFLNYLSEKDGLEVAVYSNDWGTGRE